MSNTPVLWQWRYLRHCNTHVRTSIVHFDPLPGWWVRILCRVVLGWKVEEL